jgi:hypothetical protein
MSSTFKGLNLFGSGPHRFSVWRQGQALQSELFLVPPMPGTRYLGLVELRVTVQGRLVAPSETALWALRDAITAQLLDPPEPGTLLDLHGRAWMDMSFVRFRPGDRTDRGRVRSLAYTAQFLRFRQYPQSEDESQA